MSARDTQALGHGERFKNRGGLEFAPETEFDNPVRRQAIDRLSCDGDKTCRSLASIRQAANERSLAGAIRSDQAEQFATLAP